MTRKSLTFDDPEKSLRTQLCQSCGTVERTVGFS